MIYLLFFISSPPVPTSVFQPPYRDSNRKKPIRCRAVRSEGKGFVDKLRFDRKPCKARESRGMQIPRPKLF